jgi:hypothetical protein
VKAGLLFINRGRKPKFSGGIWKSVAPGQNRSNGFLFPKKEPSRFILKRNILLFRIFESVKLAVHRADVWKGRKKGGEVKESDRKSEENARKATEN